MPALSLFDPDDVDANRAVQIVTVRDLFTVFLERTADAQTGKAFAERKRLLDTFVVSCGNVPILDLIPDDLEGWIEKHPTWKSDWTKLRVAATIKRPFGWAIRKGLIGRNPFAAVSYATGPRGRPISEKYFLSFMKASKAIFRRVLLFLSITGCRPGELSALEWTFIDTDEGTITLHVHKTARTRKDRAPRVIYLTALAVRLLTWIRRHQIGEQKYVFLNARGEPWRKGSLDLRIWRLRELLGIPKNVKLYGFRHAWATRLAISGTDLIILAALLGHTSTRMSEHYCHVAGKTKILRAALEKGLNGKP